MESTFRTHSVVPGTVRVAGAFRPNGSSALSNTAARNTLYGIASISRITAGKFTVTLPFGGAGVRNIKLGFRLSALPANIANIFVLGAATVSTSAISFTIQYTENNVAVDIADNAANWIDWELVVDNGTVPL